jgi:hypothetical protein
VVGWVFVEVSELPPSIIDSNRIEVGFLSSSEQMASPIPPNASVSKSV